MAEELELSDYEIVPPKTAETTSSEPVGSERRLFRVGLLTLGILCILQVTLNISLRVALYSKEDIDQFPDSSSVVEDLCHFEQLQQNSSQPCSCCNNLLKRLLKKSQALETERSLLQHKISQLKEYIMRNNDFEISGSGFPDVSSELS